MNLLKKFTQTLSVHKLSDETLIVCIVVMAVIFKLHKADYFLQL
jgi:hypothetical protein